MTTKQAGEACPQCKAVPCAEYAMLVEPPRWACNRCGTTGFLTGNFTGCQPTKAPPPKRP